MKLHYMHLRKVNVIVPKKEMRLTARSNKIFRRLEDRLHDEKVTLNT